MLARVGVDRAWIDGVPHPVLFRRFAEALGVHPGDAPEADHVVGWREMLLAVPGTTTAPGEAMYASRNERLNINFGVERLAFRDIQVMDPRMLCIAPGCNNEFHKHAHESIFVVLDGEGEVRVGDRWSPVKTGDVAFVPRWIPHQTRNTSSERELVILAITDFGFTSAVLGDDDRRTRLAQKGDDVTTG